MGGTQNGKAVANGKAKNGNITEKVIKLDPCPKPAFYVFWLVQLNITMMLVGAMVATLFDKWGIVKTKRSKGDPRMESFQPLGNSFDATYTDHIYRQSTDVVNRPISGVPGAIVRLKDRYTDDHGWTQKYTGTESEVINLGSYNYLGFSHRSGVCAEAAAAHIDKYGINCGGSRQEIGNHVAHKSVESTIAQYLNVEDAIVFPMGFATNSMNIPSLVDKGSLILSDRLNHASLVTGCRLSGAHTVVFRHNDASDCERKLRDALCGVSPKTGEKYNKVLIIIEGIYSMEGTIVNLPAFIAVKKKYNCYLFLDEAHSIGAVGPSGRGVAEYWGCNPRDIDIMMGTLTKSFASAGGYMGGSKKVIDHIRRYSAGTCYGVTMSPPLIAQVERAVLIMSGKDGTDIGRQKAIQLLENSRYFRKELRKRGFLVYGNNDSPVVPLMTFYITKVVEFSRRMLKHNIGIVAVGYPATPLLEARVRFCLSADHTKEHLDYILEAVEQVGMETGTFYGTKIVDE
ncbi:Serine palmitoyltransferase 3 [Caenorhabditis elegans]|uniref:Serine palmitoyltransferase 3 n=2 Tax=Caenorhabditis elegans TaxID=6239 RepID=SPTC3_CAEEL|nr:Serine palmitoyltransferase 3 [Caenorhabditis elegans]Q9XVI6.2 RecName: Full=Serine palmitoyltransferase 3; AltName: Full=Long chain base biosynthesis protein 3; Short=LCB 3; AltName: Full=Serine-palmitoyl-CoA transferase 3; Short=SPT 3; Short=SPT3 [Caenorhabditis elegans]CAB03390.2 Serine palmitoyltransferase 3 [Caenorhabditis elegans]|eukprot:NP_001256548.1 Serine palmitoyltransferase 3 [Caenorhabditis elegans]